MPVETNSAMSFYEKRTALGGIAVGEYELIDNPKGSNELFHQVD
jgi:hypothetical protein